MRNVGKLCVALAVVAGALCAAAPVACAQGSIRSEARQLRQLARQIGVNTNGVNDRQLVEGFQEFGQQFGIRTAAGAARLLRFAPQGVVNQVAAQLQAQVNEQRRLNQLRINQRAVSNQRRVVVQQQQQPQVIVIREQQRNNGGGFAQALNNGFNVAGSVLSQAIQFRALRDLTSSRGGNRFLRNALLLQALQGNRGVGGLRFRIGF